MLRGLILRKYPQQLLGYYKEKTNGGNCDLSLNQQSNQQPHSHLSFRKPAELPLTESSPGNCPKQEKAGQHLCGSGNKRFGD